MNRSTWIGLSLAAWVAVWEFWLFVTHDFHPTMLLAVIVTTALVLAYAAATYLNHLIIVPHFLASKRYFRYALLLGTVMVLLTAAALAVIRVAYTESMGPDPDPNGVYKHFAIDLFGMAVHVCAAAVVVAVVQRITTIPTTEKLDDAPS